MVAGTVTIANGHIPECEIPHAPAAKGLLQDVIKRIGEQTVMMDLVTEGTGTTATRTLNGTPSSKTLGVGEMMGREMNAWLLGATEKFASENCATAVIDLHGMEVTVPTDAGLLEMIGTVGERDRVARIGSLVKTVKTANARKSRPGWILTSQAMAVVELLVATA